MALPTPRMPRVGYRVAATMSAACSGVSTIGMRRVCAPRSRYCLISSTLPSTGLTTGCTGYGATA